jgi:futalosine hydrolase
MKLLLVVSALSDVQPFLMHYNITPAQNAGMKYMHGFKILHHEVDLVETGVGVYQTAYKVTKAISAHKYHLALKFSHGNAYKEDIAIGTVLNIVNEKPGDFGMMVNNEWKDLYDLGLVNREEEPHVRGGLINLTNAYMNVFLPFKKSVGVTVNNYGDSSAVQMRRDKYKADCETGDGLGFIYPCLFEKQLLYHLCVIERNLVTGQENFNLATEKLNETLIDLIQKL